MKKFSNVTMEWEDGKTSYESFYTEEEFYQYLNETQEEIGIEVTSYFSDNPEWTF